MGAHVGGYPPQHDEYYPSTNTFPPPPANDYAQREAPYPSAEYPPGEFPPYNPADYPPPPGATPQPGSADHYEHAPRGAPQQGFSSANEPYAEDSRYGEQRYGRSGPENVSSTFGNNNAADSADDSHGACRLLCASHTELYTDICL